MFIQEIFFHLFLLVVGFILLIKGASFFADGIAAISAKFRISPAVSGFTAGMLAVSLPGAGVSIAAALNENADIAVGNMIGGNMISLLLIAGLAALISPLSAERGAVRTELVFMTAGVAFFTVCGAVTGEISFYSGLIMIALFLLFLILFAVRIKREKGGDVREYCGRVPVPEKKEPSARLLLFTVIGLAAVALGSDLAVENAAAAAAMMGVSGHFFALTLISFGSSLPVLIVCIRAALRRHSVFAISQIAGSVIFRTLFTAGATGLAGPVAFGREFLTDAVLCIAASVVFLFFCRRGPVSRRTGFFLLILYAAYLFYLLYR